MCTLHYRIEGLDIISGTNSRIVQKSISGPYWISDPNSRIIQKSISGPYWISDPIVQILVFIYLVSCLYGIRVIKWNSQLNLGRRSYYEFELWTFRYDTSITTQAGTGRYLISGLDIISGTNSRIVQKSISSPYWIRATRL